MCILQICASLATHTHTFRASARSMWTIVQPKASRWTFALTNVDKYLLTFPLPVTQSHLCLHAVLPMHDPFYSLLFHLREFSLVLCTLHSEDTCKPELPECVSHSTSVVLLCHSASQTQKLIQLTCFLPSCFLLFFINQAPACCRRPSAH